VGDPACVNLPWNTASFVLGGRRYTCVYLAHPADPKEARYSERTHARFGSYFEYELDEAKNLDLDYRIWLQEGEMNAEQVKSFSNDFVGPVKIVLQPSARFRRQ
jgi:hypothetical protein